MPGVSHSYQATILISLLAISAPVISTTQLQIKPKSEKLESVLSMLTDAADPGEFARSRGLFLQDRLVRVMIELTRDDVKLSEAYGIIEETRSANLLQALIPIDQLVNVAEDGNVVFVRAPLTAAPMLPESPEQEPIQEEQPPSTPFLSVAGISAVAAIILIAFYLGRRRR